LREVFCPVLKFREEKQTFAKVERHDVDFFLIGIKKHCTSQKQHGKGS
jgi:hypothetical protein